ncbi:phosphoglucosamine mutase [Neolewinella lacunae]|uniref:Phosphoglucosamine mutase n=1 Tax=Neolewinella lacunae TaxID=1517758 RepID=A0A923T772_9BACT|nr:phosphoglucosamine mutase [Neolewinella lacunae]MBC6993296.1 phosphoglucosamine mutase [Neolewinella lacunae]MDN3636863.1 phosphoglucosamine mutase [Neolewinella lacunae]
MPLKKSISGFRGTIGGKAGDNLTPEDIVSNVAGYGTWLLQSGARPLVVIGRDGRPSGPVVKALTVATLQSLGIDVIDCDYATTPTVEMAVVQHRAGGGIILSASHNPREYNALKLLNEQGEFISAAAGADLLAIVAAGDITYCPVDELGTVTPDPTALDHHIAAVLAHPLVDVEAIRAAEIRVVLDAVNSVGAISIPPLCAALGVTCEVMYGELNGQFGHGAEPLPENLTDLIARMRNSDADLGIAVDPDVDRLALVGPGGRWIGEEYTLAVVADYVLRHTPGPVVSNLSSSRTVADLAASYGQPYHAAAVGEVNVVEMMKSVGAVIGGEGNGGIIDPNLHYGRDSLIGLALVLSHLATSGQDINHLRDTYAHYEMIKDKLDVDANYDLNAAFRRVRTAFPGIPTNDVDGLKLDFPDGWVHLRASNTEPIVRIYAEAPSVARARELVASVKQEL